MSAEATPSTINPTQAFYDRISKAYDLISDGSEHKARERGEEVLGVAPGNRVLEIGYGTGHACLDLAKLVGEQGQVVGIDISPGMREVARKRLQEGGVADRVQLDVGDARKLPYADGEFDHAFTSFTLELFPLEDIPAVLQEVLRVLKPGGRLGVVSMYKKDHSSVLTHVYQWMHRHFPHIVDCQPIDSPQFLQSAGFQIVHQEELSIWSLPVIVVVGQKP